MISVIVLGAGAGGGFPQWNSNAPGCRRARAGDEAAAACTQTSIAVSGDGANWFVLNAAPDLRAQIERTRELHPAGGLRSSPIAGVVLAGSEVDAVAGLLTLREGQHFTLYATAPALAHLDDNPIFEVLDRTLVRRVPVRIGAVEALSLPDGRPSGLSLRAIAVPGKAPLYMDHATRDHATRDRAGRDRAGERMQHGEDAAETVGLEISDGERRLLFVPGCARMTDALRACIAGVDCLFFDATLWRDDEMIAAGLSRKTGGDMGHMSLSGPSGVLAALDEVPIGRRILIHLNNSNPVLLADSAERAQVREAGWNVAYDGMRFAL